MFAVTTASATQAAIWVGLTVLGVIVYGRWERRHLERRLARRAADEARRADRDRAARLVAVAARRRLFDQDAPTPQAQEERAGGESGADTAPYGYAVATALIRRARTLIQEENPASRNGAQRLRWKVDADRWLDG